jgi:hypothetical protein
MIAADLAIKLSTLTRWLRPKRIMRARDEKQ